MSNWKQRLAETFAEYVSYRPGAYIGQFPDLQILVSNQPDELTNEELGTILWKARYVGDRNLVGRCLPETVSRYLEERFTGQTSRLYTALLTWENDWTSTESAVLTDALLAHWRHAVEQHGRKLHSVTTHEVAFLLLWLSEMSPLDPILSDMAQRYYRQEIEFVWDENWDSVSWTPFITKLRSNSLHTLLGYATFGEMSLQEYHPDPDRMANLISGLARVGILVF